MSFTSDDDHFHGRTLGGSQAIGRFRRGRPGHGHTRRRSTDRRRHHDVVRAHGYPSLGRVTPPRHSRGRSPIDIERHDDVDIAPRTTFHASHHQFGPDVRRALTHRHDDGNLDDDRKPWLRCETTSRRRGDHRDGVSSRDR